MLTVEQVMSKEIFALASDADLEQAAISLTHRRLSGAPVQDEAGTLIGIVSKSDLIAPHPNSWRKRKDITVLDVMTPNVYSVYADDPALAAVQELARREVHQLVVYSRDGAPVGMLSSMDVVRALAGGAVFSVSDA
jgi:CBS-domain-containing membrane protein